MCEQNAPKRKTAWLKYGIIVACVALLLGVSFGIYAYITKARENTEQSIGETESMQNTEQLANQGDNSRNITVRSFTMEGTTQNPTQTTQLAPKELLLPNQTGNTINLPARDKYRYRMDWEYGKIPGSTQSECKESSLEKYDGETLLWRATVTDFRLDKYTVVSDGVIINGYSGEKSECTWLAKISDTGEILWKYRLDKFEYIRAVLENADGSYSVFSTHYSDCFSMHKFSADGQLILFHDNDTADGTFGCIAPVGDGYLAQLSCEESVIVRLDGEGKITEYLSYSEENINYNIQDIIVYNGKVYMSGNVTPKIAERNPDSHNGIEVYDRTVLCEDINNDESLWAENKEDGVDVTDRYRNHYAAMLLVCDVSTGIPCEYYYVKESKGGDLTVNDEGLLLWDVKELRTVLYTALNCANPEWIECQWHRYAFDDTGALVMQEKTDTIKWE